MSKAEEMGNAMDAAAANLRETLAIVGAANEAVEQGANEFEQGEGARTELVLKLDADFGEFIKSVADMQETLETLGQSAEEGLEAAKETAIEVRGKLESRIGSITSLQEAFAAALAEVRSELDGGVEEVKGATESVEEQLTEILEAVAETKQSMEDTFSALKDAVQSVHDSLNELGDQTVELFQQAGTQIAEEITETAATAFTEIIDGIANDFLPAVQDDFSEMGEALGDIFNNLGDTAEALGSELINIGKEFMENLGSEVADTLKEQITEAFEQCVNDVVAAVVSEIVENVVMMQIGTAVTSSIATFLPMLMVAEKVLEAFNAILEKLEALGL